MGIHGKGFTRGDIKFNVITFLYAMIYKSLRKTKRFNVGRVHCIRDVSGAGQIKRTC